MAQYYTLLQGTSDLSDQKKILLLWFKHAQLLQLMDLTADAKEGYHDYASRESRIDSRRSKLLPRLLETITTDAYLYEEIATLADNYAPALESLINVVGAVRDLSAPDPDPAIPEPQAARHIFQSIVIELRGLCSEFRHSTSHMPQRLEPHLEFLGMRRNIED